MSSAVKAEIERLAALLGCPAKDLSFLNRFSAPQLRAFRLTASAWLRADQEPTFRRIARAGRLLPAKVTAATTRRAMDADVAAGVVSALKPQQAADIAGCLPTDYLADVTRHLSSDAAAPVVTRLSDEVILAVSRELRSRRDFTAMAEIISALSGEQTAYVAQALDDPKTLVQVAVRISDDGAIDRLVQALPDDLLSRLVRVGSRQARLWPELLELLGRVPAGRRRRLLAAAVPSPTKRISATPP
ncbi:MAG: magnesium transporter MgtE N-terminal domain-containing protein [Nocardioidaceae bacterium]